MPISSSDLLVKQSVVTGSAGNTTAGGAAGTNLGKYISTTQLVDATLDNLFPDVTGDENAASNVDYQCMFIHNSHATLTLQNPKAWLFSETAGGASAAIATDNIGATALGSSSAQAAQIANKNTAPTGISAFSTATSKSTGLSLPDIAPGQVVALWVRRTAANSAAQNLDGVVVRVEGDTQA